MFAALQRLWSGSPRDNLMTVLGDAEIPALPVAAMRVLKAARDPNADNKTLGRLVSMDAGLSLRVLRMVNSAAFGLRRTMLEPDLLLLKGKLKPFNAFVALAHLDTLGRRIRHPCATLVSNGRCLKEAIASIVCFAICPRLAPLKSTTPWCTLPTFAFV